MVNKKSIVAAGVALVAGGLVAHAVVGSVAEKKLRRHLGALEAEPAIAVSQIETHRGWGKALLTARLDATGVPGLGGELAVDIGYLSRTAKGRVTFDGAALSGMIDFTAGLGSGRQGYAFNADELGAAEGTLTLGQVEGDGYIDREREHFALNVRTATLAFADADGKLRVSDVVTELEHDIDREAGSGRSHGRFAVDDIRWVLDDHGTPLEIAGLGGADLRYTAALDGDAYALRLHLGASDVVFMDSTPGRVELDLTAKRLDYAALDAVAEQALSAARQPALIRALRTALTEQAYALLSRSPALELETLTLDVALPMLGRAEAQLSGRMAFDGDGLRPEAARAELTSRLNARLVFEILPDAMIVELAPPALQAFLLNREPPHVFGWKDGRALYKGEPLEEALAR